MTAAGLAVVAAVAGAQTPPLPPRDAGGPPPGAARIQGRVVAAESGAPLGRAQVTLGAPSAQLRRTLTDDGGRYEFAEVVAGTYSISASKTGYVTVQYGQRRPFQPGTPVAVAGGQTVERIDISLPRGAVITARVTDDLGAPMAGVSVRAQRFQYRPDGQRTLAYVSSGVLGPMQTDDRGEIRLFGLMPGEYIVSATSIGVGPTDPGASTGYAPTFYPGVISASQAAAVSVRLGEEVAVQFALVRSRLARVSGSVVDALGRPANGARVWLAGASPAVRTGANAEPDGSFSIGGVPPDDYAVLVTFEGIEQVASTLAVAGDDVSGLRVVIGPGTTVSGRVVYEGAARPARTEPIRVVLAPVNRTPAPGLMPDQRTAQVDADGRFGFTGMSGRIIVDVAAPEGWMMKSVAAEGQDVTHAPLDLAGRATLSSVVITMTDKLTALNGQVTDARAQPVVDYAVAIVPAEMYEAGVMTRRVRVVRPGSGGQFATRGLMPGRYVALAVEALEEGRQFSPDFQQQVRRLGQPFTVREGGTETLQLRLTPDL